MAERVVQRALGVVLALAAGSTMAEEAVELPEILVSERLIKPTRQTEETVYTGLAVTEKGIEVGGARAATQVAGAIDLLPGVYTGMPDSRGLGVEQSSVRLRGVPGSLGTLTVEGVPNWGGNPIGPRDYLYDMANFSGVSVYPGSVPVDLGSGVGTRAGAIVLHPKWPNADPGAVLEQTVGSHGFTRTYARLTSGAVGPADTRIAGAMSYTDANKWRGPGALGPRGNANLALVQPLGKTLEVKVWANHNDQDQHLYRPLTYGQISDLSQNFKLDFNATPTGRPAQDIYYYNYNRGDYRNDDAMAILDWRPRDDLRLTLKPYWSQEKAEVLQGLTSPGGGQVQQRDRDISRSGFLGDVALKLGPVTGQLGYQYELADMDISTQNFAITPAGLSWRGAGVVATTGTTYVHSPYLKLSGSAGPLSWQGGLKYFRFEDSASDGYTSGPAPNYRLVRAPDLDRDARTYDIWLPSLGLAWDLTPEAQIYTSWGRGFIRPYAYLPLVNTYSTNRAAFRAAGVTLDSLFDGYTLEESDTLDLGLRWRTERFELLPTLYLARYENLLTTVSDPRVLVGGKPVSYRQNVGEASGYGIDLSANLYPTDDLMLFVNPSFTRLSYDGDLSFRGTTLDTDGNQLDAAHTESVGDYLTVDLALRWETKVGGRTLKAGLELSNLFEQRYVAAINAFDDTQAGAATYTPGAPFMAMLTLGIEL